MTTSFKEVEDKFGKVFGYIRCDLERMLTLHPGVNFAAALLISCACEILAKYRNGSRQGDKVFKDLLPSGPYRTAAKPIYTTLRNGLVHGYAGGDVQFDGQTLRLAISWGKHEHLSIIKKNGEVPNLVLNVRQLCEELFSIFDKYKDQLEKSDQARKSFLDRYSEEDKEVEVTDCNQIYALQEIVMPVRDVAPEREKEAPWMAGFGTLSDLSSENRRIAGVIEAEFETLDPEDMT